MCLPLPPTPGSWSCCSRLPAPPSCGKDVFKPGSGFFWDNDTNLCQVPRPYGSDPSGLPTGLLSAAGSSAPAIRPSSACPRAPGFYPACALCLACPFSPRLLSPPSLLLLISPDPAGAGLRLLWGLLQILCTFLTGGCRPACLQPRTFHLRIPLPHIKSVVLSTRLLLLCRSELRRGADFTFCDNPGSEALGSPFPGESGEGARGCMAQSSSAGPVGGSTGGGLGTPHASQAAWAPGALLQETDRQTVPSL